MKKLLKLSLIPLALALFWSCQTGDIVEEFKKPTDVENPHPVYPVDFSVATLGDLAENLGIKLGVAFTYNEYFQNDSVAKILNREFKSVTFGNEMKNDAIVSDNGKFNFAKADEMVEWSKECGVELFGHVLGWHSQQNTKYLESLLSKAAADNSASVLQKNWNFEEGTSDGFEVSAFEPTTDFKSVFAGDCALKSNADDASVSFVAGIEADKAYTVSFWAKADNDGTALKLASGDGQQAAATVSAEWAKYSVCLKTKSIGDFSYKISAGKGVSIDNIRVEETEVEEETGGGNQNYINPYAVGAIDFEDYAAGSTGTELVGNYGWTQCNGASYVTVVADDANSGKQSLKMANADGHCANAWDIQAITPAFDVEAGTTYRIAWYGKASEECDIQIDIREDGSTVAYKSSAYSQYDKTGKEWKYIFLDYTVASGTSLSVAFYGGTSAVDYYLDDFQIFNPIYEGDYTNFIDPANLLVGADFENAAAWGIWNGSEYAEIISRNEPEIGANKDFVHSGLRALKVDNNGTGWTGGSSWHIQIANNNKVPVTGGDSYRVGMWVKSPDGATTIQIHLSWDDGSTNYVQIPGIGSDWTYIFTDKVAPATASEVQLVIDAAFDEATYYIDDVQLLPTPKESFIDPSAIGGIDFEDYAAGSTGTELVGTYGWTQCNGASYVTVVADDANSGKQSLKMANADGHCANAWDIQAITPAFDVEAGTTYRIAWYGKANEECDIQIDIREDGSTVAYKSSAYSQYDKTGTEWKYIFLDYTVATGTKLSIAFYGGTSAVDYYLDDFQIFPAPAAPSPAPAFFRGMAFGKVPARVATVGKSFGKYPVWTRPAARISSVSGSDLGKFSNTAKLDGELANDCIGYAYKNFVYNMIEHFDAYAWDVVNETFTEDGNFRNADNTPEGFVWGTYFADTKTWVDKAFAYAEDALEANGKEAELYINEYNLETSPAKRTAVCNYAKNNDKVSGIGTQMHLDITSFDLETLETFVKESLEELAATGKKVRISELDIVTSNTDDQAKLYAYIFEKYLELVPASQRGGITIWGINDKDSWLGESKQPLLWTGNKYTPKPAYEELFLLLCKLNDIDPHIYDE